MPRFVPRPFLVVVAAAACASSGTQPAPAVVPTPPAQGELSPADLSRMTGGQPPYIKADVIFMSGMIGHHAQAVLMGKWAPSHGASRSVQTFCERVVVGQRDEIFLMQRWLRERKEVVPTADTIYDASHAQMMHDMPGMHMPALMPGMLTPVQLARLDSARGPEFDRLFLRYMIQHHQGAIVMVEALFAGNGGQDNVVFKFASDVFADQTTEIDRMSVMLASMTPPR